MRAFICLAMCRLARCFTGVFLLAGAWVGGASAQSPPIEAALDCAVPAFAVVVIDDGINTPPWLAETARRYRVLSPAQVLKQVLRDSQCIELLDSDPVFWSIPGAREPELILRAAVIDVVEAQRNLGEKASSAVGRYLGAYLGDHQPDSPLLQSVAVQVDVLCPRARQRVARLEARNAPAQPRSEISQEANNALMQSAFTEAVRGLPAALGKDAPACRRPARPAETLPAARSDAIRPE